MEWAMGFRAGTFGQCAEMVSVDGSERLVRVEELLKLGVPCADSTKEVVFEGELSQFVSTDEAGYLAAYGFPPAILSRNRHGVLAGQARTGIQIVVPALAFMRAMFKPNKNVFPAIFTPSNVDTLCYVDYGVETPEVVVDDLYCISRIGQKVLGVNQAAYLRWLQLSRSARQRIHEVHMRAHLGALEIHMPHGQVRMVCRGRLVGDRLFATKVSIVKLVVSEEDSISSMQEEFVFNGNAITAQKRSLASAADFKVRLRPGGDAHVSDFEWKIVEPMLNGTMPGAPIHSKREILDVVLQKISSKRPWTKMALGEFSVTNVTTAFRRWCTDGRMLRVSTVLEELRRVDGQAP